MQDDILPLMVKILFDREVFISYFLTATNTHPAIGNNTKVFI